MRKIRYILQWLCVSVMFAMALLGGTWAEALVQMDFTGIVNAEQKALLRLKYDAKSATLVFSVDNTSLSADARLNGVYLNLPEEILTGSQLVIPTGWAAVSQPDAAPTMQFGVFRLLLLPDSLDNPGLAPGESVQCRFVFDPSTTEMSSIEQFLQERGIAVSMAQEWELASYFLIRFNSNELATPGNDIVYKPNEDGIMSINEPGNKAPAADLTAVPEPSTFILFGFGLLGLLGVSKRIRRKYSTSHILFIHSKGEERL